MGNGVETKLIIMVRPLDLVNRIVSTSFIHYYLGTHIQSVKVKHTGLFSFGHSLDRWTTRRNDRLRWRRANIDIAPNTGTSRRSLMNLLVFIKSVYTEMCVGGWRQTQWDHCEVGDSERLPFFDAFLYIIIVKGIKTAVQLGQFRSFSLS